METNTVPRRFTVRDGKCFDEWGMQVGVVVTLGTGVQKIEFLDNRFISSGFDIIRLDSRERLIVGSFVVEPPSVVQDSADQIVIRENNVKARIILDHMIRDVNAISAPLEMEFNATVTTNRRGRDGDILDPKGMTIDPNVRIKITREDIEKLQSRLQGMFHKSRYGKGIMLDRGIVDACDIQLPPVEGCPDCYVGLAGQIEKCEKHRE